MKKEFKIPTNNLSVNNLVITDNDIMIYSTREGKIVLRDFESNKEIGFFIETIPILMIGLDKENGHLIAYTKDIIKIWNLSSTELIKEISFVYRNIMSSLRVVGRYILICDSGREIGLWDKNTYEDLMPKKLIKSIKEIWDISSDGEYLVTVEGDKIKIEKDWLYLGLSKKYYLLSLLKKKIRLN